MKILSSWIFFYFNLLSDINPHVFQSLYDLFSSVEQTKTFLKNTQMRKKSFSTNIFHKRQKEIQVWHEDK